MKTEGKVVVVSSTWPRSLFLGSSLCTLALAVKSPASLTAVLVMGNGLVGVLGASVFAVAFVLLALDFVAHDVLPIKFTIRALRDYRWLWISSMSIVYWMFGTVSLLPQQAPDGAWVLIAWYFLIGVWGMAFAFTTKVGLYKEALRAEP